MADPKDVEATKMVRREFNRRKIDATLADIRILHGVLYVRGTFKGIGGSDPKVEFDVIIRALRGRGMVREVVSDVLFR